jgi:hypothetical protein
MQKNRHQVSILQTLIVYKRYSSIGTDQIIFDLISMDLEQAPRNQRLKQTIQASDCCYRVDVLTDLVAQYAYYPFSEIRRDPRDERILTLFHPHINESMTIMYVQWRRDTYRAGDTIRAADGSKMYHGSECDICGLPKWSETIRMSESTYHVQMHCKRHNPKHLTNMTRLDDRREANRGIVSLDQTADY